MSVFCTNSDLFEELISLDKFSTMYAEDGYHEMSRPTDNYIIDVFQRHVQTHQEEFEKYMELNIPSITWGINISNYLQCMDCEVQLNSCKTFINDIEGISDTDI